MLRKLIFGCCTAALLLCLTGCGGSNSFTWRVDTLPANLDPQLAQESSDVTACLNLYSGLFRLDENGVPQPECCESYTVSPDGLTYTFTLKSGLTYNGYRGAVNTTPVTAHDFAFGLYRVFLPETCSPYADDLAIIAGSADVAAGAPADALGVVALDDRTLSITLQQRDENFLHKLCLPGAMPCNEEFFRSSGGAYGLAVRMVQGNGPFYLYNWTESGLFLRRKASGSQVDALRIVEHAEDGGADEPLSPPEQVKNGKSDAALYSGAAGTGLGEISYTNITWCLFFDCRNRYLSNSLLRGALAQSALDTAFSLPEGYLAADGLVPPSVTLGAESYRSLAGRALPSQSASLLYKQALEELGVSSVRGLTVLIPAEEPARSVFSSINQHWQSQLGIYCNVVEVPLEELSDALDFRDGAIVLAPLSMNSNSPRPWLEAFGSGQYTGWADEEYRLSLGQLSAFSPSVSQMAAAERYLLQQASLTPLYHQSQLLLVSPQIGGLVFDPFGPTLDLTWATKS